MAIWDHHTVLHCFCTRPARGRMPTNTVQSVIWIFAPLVACQSVPCLLGLTLLRKMWLGDGQTKSWYNDSAFFSVCVYCTVRCAKTSCILVYMCFYTFGYSFIGLYWVKLKNLEPQWCDASRGILLSSDFFALAFLILHSTLHVECLTSRLKCCFPRFPDRHFTLFLPKGSRVEHIWTVCVIKLSDHFWKNYLL